MSFEKAYSLFIQQQLSDCRTGERRGRLKKGLGHAEVTFLKNVWWPAFGNFDFLHPEYEVNDFKDGFRYLDFAYIHNEVRICFEIDGYGPHWRDISRWKFADQNIRQNDLVIDDWKVIRFAYDHVIEKPRFCQQIVQQLMGRWQTETIQGDFNWVEKEIIRFARREAGPFAPKQISQHLNVSGRYARELLHKLVEKGKLLPVDGKKRIRTYMLKW